MLVEWWLESAAVWCSVYCRGCSSCGCFGTRRKNTRHMVMEHIVHRALRSFVRSFFRTLNSPHPPHYTTKHTPARTRARTQEHTWPSVSSIIISDVVNTKAVCISLYVWSHAVCFVQQNTATASWARVARNKQCLTTKTRSRVTDRPTRTNMTRWMAVPRMNSTRPYIYIYRETRNSSELMTMSMPIQKQSFTCSLSLI